MSTCVNTTETPSEHHNQKVWVELKSLTLGEYMDVQSTEGGQASVHMTEDASNSLIPGSQTATPIPHMCHPDHHHNINNNEGKGEKRSPLEINKGQRNSVAGRVLALCTSRLTWVQSLASEHPQE